MTRARDNSFNPFNNQAAGRNIVINGGMDIWQRGTSISTWLNGITTVDRWYFQASASTLYAQDSVNVAGGCRYSLKGTVGAGVANVVFYSAIETSNAIALANQTTVFSAYVATSTSASVTLMVQYSTAVDEPLVGTWTTAYTSNFTTTTTLERKQVTGTIPSTAKSIRVSVASSSNLAAGSTINVTGVQLELGSTPTVFSRAGGTIVGELLLCQRYYQKSYSQGTNPATNNSPGAEVRMGASRTDQYATDSSFSFPVAMRIPPSVLLYSSTNSTVNSIYDAGAGVNRSAAVFNIGDNRAQIGLGSGVTTTANTAYVWHWVASAEL
jgi:hypothetical protein